MDSFYGGKQGVSFVIKAKFSSIEEMLTNFRNVNYKSVFYGEYCIIDTINKNNKDNGKVFRRTLNTAGDEYDGLAEYIGQIVGPAGGTPNIELGGNDYVSETFDAFETLPTNSAIYYKTIENNTITNKYDLSASPAIFEANSIINAPTAAAGEVQESDYHTITFKSGNSYITKVVTPTGDPEAQGWYELNNKNYIPTEDNTVIEGKDYYINNTPTLRYSWYNFREADADNEDDPGFAPAKIVIGFEIPYIYNEIVNVNELNYFNTPTITVNSPNTFYNQYTLNIPRGIPGAYINNIRRMTVSEIPSETTCYDFPVSSSYDEEEKKTSYSAEQHDFNDYTGSFWACEFIYPTGEPDIENTEQPAYEKMLMYIGNVKEIQDVVLESNGDLIITYTNEEIIPLDSKIKWIDGVTVSPNGSLIFNYNFDTYYKEIVNPTGNPYEQGWYINNGTTTTPNYEPVPSSETIVVTGTTYYQQIPDTVIANGDKLTWINNVSMQVNPSDVENFGKLTFDFNNNTISNNTSRSFNIPLLRKLTLNGMISSNGSNRQASRRIIPYYGTNSEGSTGIGDEINFIQELITTSDNHLLCLFTASSLRPDETNGNEEGKPPQNSQVYTDNNGISWRRRFLDGDYDNISLILDPRCENLNIRNVWYRDLGSLDIYFDKDPIKIARDFEGSLQEIIDYLNDHPTDFPQTPGTVVYAEDTNSEVQQTKVFIYAKDITNSSNNWVQIATIADYATSLQGKWKTSSSATAAAFTEITIINENLEAATYAYTPVWV